MTEIHLFDFEGDLYGRSIECTPLFYIRDEQKFSSFTVFKKERMIKL
ncbi:riboflavin kinase [Domibacillus iocasae]